MNALVAFESVARLGGVGRAAAELRTSQSAISRNVKRLEFELGTALFEKAGRGVAMTPAGRAYLQAVSSALEGLNSARISLRAATQVVTLACTHEVSHLLVMPQFAELRRALGKQVTIRVLTCEYETVPMMVDAGADLIFEYVENLPDEPCAVLLHEQICPVAAPSFAGAHRGALRLPPSRWGTIPRLALSKGNFGWATWTDWFAAVGANEPDAPPESYDNYVYLLEAAAAGAGLALGWKGFIDRYLQSGALVMVTDRWILRSPTLIARLTRKGESNANARRCLTFLACIRPSSS